MLDLNAKTRENIGKGINALRRSGFLPAVLYGERQENKALELDYKEFEKVYKEAGESALINLKLGDNDKGKIVIIRDIQKDPLSGIFIHADFYAIREDRPLKVMMRLVFEGEEDAPAVKELGGYLAKNIQEVEIEALPKDLPKELKVNVSELATFEDSVKIGDIVAPPGVKILTNPDEVVVSAEKPVSEEELKEELEEPIEEKVEEVEVEEKGKKEESEEAGEVGRGKKE